MTIINCDYIVITCSCRFPRFSHGSWITFWPFGSPTEPINPHTCKRKLLGDLKRLRLSPEKKNKNTYHLDLSIDSPWSMFYHDFSGCFRVFCFDRFSEPLQRSGPWAWRMDPLPSYIHNLTNWTNLCVCVAKKKGSPCKHAQKYRTLLNIIYNSYHNIIYYWLLTMITSTCLSNSLSSLLSLAVTAWAA